MNFKFDTLDWINLGECIFYQWGKTLEHIVFINAPYFNVKYILIWILKQRDLFYFFRWKVTIDSNFLSAVAETNSSIEILKVIRVKISIIISGGDSIAVGNAR